jgi:hypothetical protein
LTEVDRVALSGLRPFRKVPNVLAQPPLAISE